jgi:glycerate 2-kinase
LLEGCLTVSTAAIPQRALIVSGPFSADLDAARVVAAIAQGLRAGGQAQPDACPLPLADARAAGGVHAMLGAVDFDARMRASRAVIVGAERLHEGTLAGSVTFEIATRARQGGVPAYAVTAENELNAFDARMLDLQLVLVAASARALTATGKKLAAVV